MPNPVLCLLLNCNWAPASLPALHTWTISAVKGGGSWYCSTLHFLNRFIYVAYILYSCGPQLLYIANSVESIYRFLFIIFVLCIWWLKKIIWYCHCTEKILYIASLEHTCLQFQDKFFLFCMYMYFYFPVKIYFDKNKSWLYTLQVNHPFSWGPTSNFTMHNFLWLVQNTASSPSKNPKGKERKKICYIKVRRSSCAWNYKSH